jgi:hypothetical protein
MTASIIRSAARALVVAAALGATACSGGNQNFLSSAPSNGLGVSAIHPDKAKSPLTVVPPTLGLYSAQKGHLKVYDKGYTGTISVTVGSTSVVTVSKTSTHNDGKITVSPAGGGKTTITFKDTKGHKFVVKVQVIA